MSAPAVGKSGLRPETRRSRPKGLRRTLIDLSLQLLILAAILAGWQWIPQIPGAAKVSPVFDPFFISSPERLVRSLVQLATGSGGVHPIWGAVEASVIPALIGTALAVVAGGTAGLVCSNWARLNRVVRPFVMIGNALPRITLIPIIIVLAGPTATSDVIIGFLVVFFLVFWNAYEGGASVPTEMLENVTILGAGRFEVLRRVRFPYVLAWTFASLPNAIGFGLTAIVTAELFTGSNGLGQVLLNAVNTANADQTVAVTLILGMTGLLLIGSVSLLRRRVLHWW